jgi:ABC-type cobalamin/Fe3+-siderophores transport system ATPase subunit
MIEIRGFSARNLRVPSLTLSPGLTAVIGLNGAGKTTLLEVCCGLLLPDAGTVLVDGRTPREIEAARVTGAEGLLARSTRTLSGGERSVVALAAALTGSPTVLALDEFDGHIDRETLAELFPVVRSAGARYVFWSTHDPELAAEADHAVAIEEGTITATGGAALALFDRWEREGPA